MKNDVLFATTLALSFLGSLFAALIGTYLVRRWAKLRGLLEFPDGGRRLHSYPVPRVGGIALVVSAVGVFCSSLSLIPPALVKTEPPILFAMVGGSLVVHLIGLWDDIRGLRPRVKLALEAVVGLAVFTAGVRIHGVHLLGLSETMPTWLSLVLTLGWILATTNSFNLIDGSDGVAAGAAVFASATLTLVFLLSGDIVGALMAISLAGAALGFLFFNFPPASIFMGDGGSLFLGFTLATLGVITTQKAPTAVAIAIPVLAFGVPLLDMAIAIIRRFLRRDALFGGDRGHIHHRLSDLGHSPRGVAITLYLACAGFASLSLLLASNRSPAVIPLFVLGAAILILGVQRLNVPELTELRNVVERGFKQRWVIAHNVRLRMAAARLQTASSAQEIHAALRDAFQDSEFVRVEIRMPLELGSHLVATDDWTRFDGKSVRVGITLPQPVGVVSDLELRVPIVVDKRQVGRFSVYRNADAGRLFTDVHLLSRELVPAFVAACLRSAPILNGSSDEIFDCYTSEVV